MFCGGCILTPHFTLLTPQTIISYCGFCGLDRGLQEGVGIAGKLEHYLYVPGLSLGFGSGHGRRIGHHAALDEVLLGAGIRHRSQRVEDHLGI